MCPHDHRSAVPALEMVHQCVEGFGHMAVAQVPGGDPAPEHRAVVRLGIAGQARVLLGKEELILRTAVPSATRQHAVAARRLTDGLVLAWLRYPEDFAYP